MLRDIILKSYFEALWEGCFTSYAQLLIKAVSRRTWKCLPAHFMIHILYFLPLYTLIAFMDYGSWLIGRIYRIHPYKNRSEFSTLYFPPSYSFFNLNSGNAGTGYFSWICFLGSSFIMNILMFQNTEGEKKIIWKNKGMVLFF